MHHEDIMTGSGRGMGRGWGDGEGLGGWGGVGRWGIFQGCTMEWFPEFNLWCAVTFPQLSCQCQWLSVCLSLALPCAQWETRDKLMKSHLLILSKISEDTATLFSMSSSIGFSIFCDGNQWINKTDELKTPRKPVDANTGWMKCLGTFHFSYVHQN